MSKELKATLASWGRSFLAACLAQFLALGGGAFDLTKDGWKSIVAAGVAAVAPVVVRYLNPNDKAFGDKGEE
jgi:hypothetical protein